MPEPTSMRRFPAAVRQAMRDSGAAATCVAVQLDGDDWEAALFLQLAGPECKEERRLLRRVSGSIPVGMEADVIEHANAAVVVLRLEVHCGAPQPMPFEILLVPGTATGHFEAVKLVSGEARLTWFFGDSSGGLIHAQSHALDEAQHQGFAELLAEALRHDRLVRLTGRHDGNAALAEITSHYSPRGATVAATRV